MGDISLNAAKAAYEHAEDSAAKRVPWHSLADHWKIYWIRLAEAVIESVKRSNLAQ